MKEFIKNRILFNRNEFSGSFGDIGTDFPLIVGMIMASNFDVTSVFVMFGLMQIMTGLVYGIPMPMQPLKDKCRIPADESTCQLFLDRLKTGKTEITVTAVGRDAEGKRKFECYARHFNMSAEGSGNASIRTLVPGAGKA